MDPGHHYWVPPPYHQPGVGSFFPFRLPAVRLPQNLIVSCGDHPRLDVRTLHLLRHSVDCNGGNPFASHFDLDPVFRDERAIPSSCVVGVGLRVLHLGQAITIPLARRLVAVECLESGCWLPSNHQIISACWNLGQVFFVLPDFSLPSPTSIRYQSLSSTWTINPITTRFGVLVGPTTSCA